MTRNRITSRYLPRAWQLLAAFRDEGKRPARGQRAPLAAEEQTRQRSPGGWNVSRDALVGELTGRLNGKTLPQQQNTSYCGCAAFLYCLLEDRPDWYVAYATALWRGQPFTFASGRDRQIVNSTAETRQSMVTMRQMRTPDPKISSLDWMTMASLSGATRLVQSAQPSSARPTDEARSITWPWMVRRWFNSVGASARLDSVGTGLLRGSRDDLLNLLRLWNGNWLVMQIDSSMLTGGATSITQRHWIVVDPETRPLIQPPGQKDGFPVDDFIKWQRSAVQRAANAAGGQATVDAASTALMRLRVVSWGKEHVSVRNPTLGDVNDRFYGGFVFPRFNR